MFVGHYAVSFAAKRIEPAVPLAWLFVAVQLVDIAWAITVPLGIEGAEEEGGNTRPDDGASRHERTLQHGDQRPRPLRHPLSSVAGEDLRLGGGRVRGGGGRIKRAAPLMSARGRRRLGSFDGRTAACRLRPHGGACCR